MNLPPNQLLMLFIEKLDAHALKHYEEDGWDYWVEAHDLHEKLEIIEGAKTYKQAFDKAHELMKLYGDQRSEIQSTAF